MIDRRFEVPHKEIVAAARASLAPVGFMLGYVGSTLGVTSMAPIADQLDAVHRLEAAGFTNAWTNEYIGGKDVFVQIGMLMAATERMTFGTAISTIWSRPPVVAHAAASQLNEAHPKRFILGLGSGYPFQAAQAGLAYDKPLSQLRRYVQRLTEATAPVVSPTVNYPTILAAVNRKAIATAGEVADGAVQVMVPPSYVAEARSALGPDKLLVVGLNVFVDDEDSAAKAAASRFLAGVMSHPDSSYAKAMKAFGYGDEDLVGGGDHLLDQIAVCGSAPSITQAAQRFIDAGADHVMLQVHAAGFAAGIDYLESVGPTLSSVQRGQP